MSNFKQCNCCKIILPIQYLTTIIAKSKSSGRTTKVMVCSACKLKIVRKQQA